MKAVRHKVADAKGDMNSLAGGSRQGSFDTYVGSRHSVDQSLLAVNNFLKVIINHDTKGLQQDVNDALRSAAGGVHNSFVDAPAVVDKSLS